MKILRTPKMPPLGLVGMVSLLATSADAQLNVAQINWGSQDFSSIVDSTGVTLAEGNFTFALGAFNEGFVPANEPYGTWWSNFTVFDVADYNESGGVFAASYIMYDGNPGGVDSVGSNFETVGISRDAYLWIYNDLTPEPGTEWFIGRASDWIFPEITGDEFDNDPPLEWSVSDLTSTDVPIFGNQFDFEGLGEKTIQVTTADLQTYTFIPEPSTAMLAALAGVIGIMRRSRTNA